VIARLYAAAIVTLVGIEINVEGLEHIEASRDIAEEGAVCMFSHASNLDPFIVAAAQPLACKWVGKKASPLAADIRCVLVLTFSLSLLARIYLWFPSSGGWLGGLATFQSTGQAQTPFWKASPGLTGGVLCCRKNLDKAKASLDDAGERIKEYGRIIAISPEGTRSRTGQLADFKKGPFHLQEKTQVAVLPCTIQGAFELWPPTAVFPSAGQVTVKFLPPIYPDKERSREETAKAVQCTMLDALRTAPSGTGMPLTYAQWFKLNLKRLLLLLFVLFFYKGIRGFLAQYAAAKVIPAGVAITAALSGTAYLTL